MSEKEFEVKEEVHVLEPSEDGDAFKSIALIEGKSENEEWEYVSFRKGEVEERETADGESLLVKDVDEQVSLGNPEYLNNVQEALDELIDRIE
jgi:hypothetical protein